MKIHKNDLADKPGFWDIFFFVLTLIVCYFFFNQGDLIHTGGSSFTYLDGHIWDFYDANATVWGGPANYLPSTYILYAIWNLPLKLLHIAEHARGAGNIGYVIFWYKLLTTLLLAGSVCFMYKIGKAVGLSRMNSRLLSIIWLSSPILCFSQFIFGQTDIFCTFFVLAGLFYYFTKRMKLFLLFFGISFTFKYFPLYIFIPLLLLIEKRPFKLLSCLAFSFIPLIAEILFYSHSPAFRTGVGGFGAMSYIFSMQAGVFSGVGWYSFITIWFITCGICYWLDYFEDETAFYQNSFYICLVVLCCAFSSVMWHPQWLLFVTPFLAVTTFMSRRIKTFLFLDFIMMIAFIGFTVNVWQMNVDQQVFAFGILGKFNPQLFNPAHAVRMVKFFILGKSGQANHITNVYLSLFVAMLAINVILKFPSKNNKWGGDKSIRPVNEYWGTAKLRFFGGIAVFVVPALAVYFLTLMKHSYAKAAASSEFNTSWTAEMTVDNDSGTYWHSNLYSGQPFWLKYEFPENKPVKEYSIASRPIDPLWYPVSWELQGSNDDSTWVNIDRQTNQKFMRNDRKKFVLSKCVSYKYYKLVVTKADGNSYCVISEFNLK